MLGTCSQAPNKGNQNVEFGIYWGPLLRSDSRSANGLQQEILGAHTNPCFPFHSGHIARLQFPACLVVQYGLIPKFYPKLISPTSEFGPSKPPTWSLFFSYSGWLERGDSFVHQMWFQCATLETMCWRWQRLHQLGLSEWLFCQPVHLLSTVLWARNELLLRLSHYPCGGLFVIAVNLS